MTARKTGWNRMCDENAGVGVGIPDTGRGN